MKANPTYLLDSLSNKEVTFFIPPYQRNYEWKTETCKVFLADVSLSHPGVFGERFAGVSPLFRGVR